MDRESIHRLIIELRRRHGELEGVEAKAAHTGTPADHYAVRKRGPGKVSVAEDAEGGTTAKRGAL
jgi:hypothetical protein